MSRVLRQPTVAEAARPLRGEGLAGDPAVRALLDRETQGAYERGRQAGLAEGRQALADELSTVAQTVQESVGVVLEEIRAIRAQDAEAVTELAIDIAEAIVGTLDAEGVDLLVERVRRALAAIDDRPITIRANPDQADELDRAMAASDDVEVVADPAMSVGEARLVGPWSSAEVTWEAAWDAVRRALRGD